MLETIINKVNLGVTIIIINIANIVVIIVRTKNATGERSIVTTRIILLIPLTIAPLIYLRTRNLISIIILI